MVKSQQTMAHSHSRIQGSQTELARRRRQRSWYALTVCEMDEEVMVSDKWSAGCVYVVFRCTVPVTSDFVCSDFGLLTEQNDGLFAAAAAGLLLGRLT